MIVSKICPDGSLIWTTNVNISFTRKSNWTMFPPYYNDYPYDIYNARNWLEFGWILDRRAKFTYSEIEHMSYFKTKSFFIISCLKEKQMNRSYPNQLHSISIWVLSINGREPPQGTDKKWNQSNTVLYCLIICHFVFH